MHLDTTYTTPNIEPRTHTLDTIVIHSTEGLMPGCAEWLCNPKTRVSTHYIVARSGVVYQLASDTVVTWHAGVSAWPDSPERTRYHQDRTYQPSVNQRSLGVELEHVEGGAPYTDVQQQALADLLMFLLARYRISYTYTHADVALPKGRKHDPTDWPDFYAWAVRNVVLSPPASPVYTEDSPILGTSPRDAGQVYAALASRFPIVAPDTAHYSQADMSNMLHDYWDVCESVGVNPLLAVSQMLHETANLQAFWSLRPQRNPAGIGVTGGWQHDRPTDTTGWAYNTQRHRWEMGVSFKSWQQHSIPAHIGRLLAWALTDHNIAPFPNGGDPQLHQHQRALIDQALSYRTLPVQTRGSAPTLKQLGRVHNASGIGWASPGLDYGAKIAAVANRLLEAS